MRRRLATGVALVLAVGAGGTAWAVTASRSSSSSSMVAKTYTVAAGDTLNAIAGKTGVPEQRIADLNGITDPASLLPDQVLRVTEGPFAPCAAGTVRLTFDDGPSPDVTPRVLDILKKNELHATFFVVGAQVTANPAVLRREVAEGHEVGDHTWDHAHLLTLTQDQARLEIARTADLIQQVTGKRPTEFRPPYGETNDSLRATERDLGLRETLWTIDPDDWEKPTGADLTNRVVPKAVNGSVLLLHDANSTSPDGLQSIIDDLRDRGLCMR